MYIFVSATEMAWAVTSEHSLHEAQQKITNSVTILARAGGLVLKQKSVVKGHMYRGNSIHNYNGILGTVMNNCCQTFVALLS
jgi:hypothetical protein